MINILKLLETAPEMTMKMLRSRRNTLVFLIMILLAACSALPTEEPPGVGKKAERGYAACNPIIEVLEQYKEANGSYPESLAELVPDYISGIPDRVNDQPILYQKTAEGFTLSFEYIGPGMNICTYSPEAGWRWNCSGAY